MSGQFRRFGWSFQIDQNNFSTALRKLDRNRAANTASRTRDDCHLVFQRCHCVPSRIQCLAQALTSLATERIKEQDSIF
jgi:hypothetical protein